MSNRTFARLADSFVNFVSRIGVAGGKDASNTYQLEALNQQQVEAAYRTSWLAKKVINIPPLDMTREWRLWQAEDDQIEDLEQEEKRLKLVAKVRRAMTWGRLYGGAAIILGVENGNPSEPLEVEKVKEGQLKFIHVVSRHRLSGTEIDRDPMSVNYGAPKMYTVSSSSVGSLDIHPSRVIRFIGSEAPDDDSNIDGWGDPYWMSLKDIVGSTDLLTSVISGLVQEAKVDVITIPDMLNVMGSAEDEARLLKRVTLAMAVKSTNNTLLLDGGTDGKTGEKWERKEMEFAGLADILRLYLAVAAGAADIPATRLLGKSPDGLNATGDNDLRNYYDMISSRQELEMWPAIAPLDEIMMRSLGFSDSDIDGISFESAPLWQMTPAEKAAVAKQKAETTQVYISSGAVPEEAFAKAVQNQLIEDQIYPGFEQALEEFPEPKEEEPPVLALPPPVPGQTPLLAAPPQDSFSIRDRTPYSPDPTFTGQIRQNWTGSIRTRLKMTEGRIRSLIRSNEGVGLTPDSYREILDKSFAGAWWKKYAVRAYRRGADDASRKLEIDPVVFDERDAANIEALSIGIDNDLTKLKSDVAEHIHSGVSTSVTVGAALNHVASSIKMGSRRAKLIAAVNAVAAHSKASLHIMKNNGVQFVGADIEAASRTHDHQDEDLLQFATAGDNNVCPECEDLEGQVFTVDEADGVIPVHPECRCAWIPIRDPAGRFNPRIGREDSISDAAPRTLYIRRDVINAAAIIAWAKGQGFETTLLASDMHVTVCYSRMPIDWMKVGESYGQDEKGRMIVKPGGARLVERLGDATALLFNSSELSWRHEDIKRAGASYDFEQFQPHITITYNAGGKDLSEIEPYRGEIVLGPEIFEEIDDGYRQELQEE